MTADKSLRKLRKKVVVNLSKYIAPGSRIGIVGGGQLGQMMAASAVEMGYCVSVLDPTEGCPASLVAEHIVADYDDADALKKLADDCDVLTYEFENVSADTLESSGGYLPQGVKALTVSQDRLSEKAFLTEVGVPVAPYRQVDSVSSLQEAIEELGYPCVVKTTRGGYDGKGQVVVRADEDLEKAQDLLSVSCVIEKWIPFEREISVVVAGDQYGNYRCFPIGENAHHHNILHSTTVPARISTQVETRALDIARSIAENLSLVGVMGVEMFVTAEEELFVNELAPRPHNSGHYTIEACDFSQFDAHIRGICGWEIGEPQLLSSATMINILGQDMDEVVQMIPAQTQWHVHLYGKNRAQENRKMGHITILEM